jgi:hypothetical protein
MIEWQSLFHLEQELDVALQFEHGDGSGGGPKVG